MRQHTEITRQRRRHGRRAAALAAILGTGGVLAGAAATAATGPLDVQQQVSETGDSEARAAYNPRADQYLLVYTGRPGGDRDVYGRLVDGAGTPQGGEFRISDMGPDGDAAYIGVQPDVTYNARQDEYLVVWEGEDDTAPLVDDEREIFAQRVSAAGAEVGANDVRISSMGPDSDPSFDAENPSVAFDITTGQYLVAWYGDDDRAPLVVDENEIFVQRLDATGAEIGADDRRISDMGVNGLTTSGASDPDVAFDEGGNAFLVVWEGDDGTAPLADNESEIFGQRLDADGGEIGANDARISSMGTDGDPVFDARNPVVVHNEQSGEYLVAWSGDDLVDEELEIHAQRLDAAGAEVGTDDQRVSDMGPDGDVDFHAFRPAVAYDERSDEYLVAWHGEDAPALGGDEREVFEQRLSAAGTEIDGNDVRVSSTGPDGDPAFVASNATVAFGSQRNEYLIAWTANSDVPPLSSGTFRVFARRVGAAPPVQAQALCRALPPAPTPTPGDPSQITLSVAQLRINQRIDQAAIRRANGVQDWLDAGIEGRDLCQGAVSRADLRGEVIAAYTGVPVTLSAPSPRPVPVAAPGPPDPGSVTLTTTQMLINQRISQAAIRRLNALKARLDAGLTGGDVDDGQIGPAQLAAGTRILVAPPPVGPPAASVTSIAPAKPGDPGSVSLSVGQLLINQRISQAGVRRANDLIRRIDAGLGTAEIGDATLTAADLAPGLALSDR